MERTTNSIAAATSGARRAGCARRTAAILAGTTALVALGASPAGAVEFLEGRLLFDFYIMESFQSIEADDDAFDDEDTDTSSGFQRLRFDLGITFQPTDNITGFVELGEEPNDFGADDPFEISQDLGFIDVALLGLYDDATGSSLSDRHEFVVRAGNLVTTVFNFRGYSDGAVVQSNPLIGNSPADMVTAESGIQLRATHQLGMAPIETFNWDVGLSVPTFFEDFGAERGYNVFGRASVDTTMGLGLGFGWFVNDLGDQVGERPFGDIQTAEMLFGDGENYNFPGSGASARDTHSGLLPGLDATVFHVDAEYDAPFLPLLLRGWAGYAKDDFSFVNGAGDRTVRSEGVDFVEEESREHFFAFEGTFYVIPETLYAAARYTRVVNDSSGVEEDEDTLERVQLGGGWFFAENTLLKGEYVHQNEEDDSPGQIGDDWDGFMVELSTLF